MSDNTNKDKPALSQFYRPADKDTVLIVRFAGNTPGIVGFGSEGQLTPGHLLAAAAWLEIQGRKMILDAEIAMEQNRIQQADATLLDKLDRVGG